MSRTKHHKDHHLFKGMGPFKKIRKRGRRAKEKQAVRVGRVTDDFDRIPKFKKDDKYDYL